MLLRTTIPPRRDGTVIATVGDRRYTFSAGYGCEVLWCDVDLSLIHISEPTRPY